MHVKETTDRDEPVHAHTLLGRGNVCQSSFKMRRLGKQDQTAIAGRSEQSEQYSTGSRPLLPVVPSPVALLAHNHAPPSRFHSSSFSRFLPASSHIFPCPFLIQYASLLDFLFPSLTPEQPYFLFALSLAASLPSIPSLILTSLYGRTLWSSASTLTKGHAVLFSMMDFCSTSQ